MAYEKAGDLQRAVDLMQVCVDFEREIDHTDAKRMLNILRIFEPGWRRSECILQPFSSIKPLAI